MPLGEESPLKVKKMAMTAKLNSSTKKIARRIELGVSAKILSLMLEMLMLVLVVGE